MGGVSPRRGLILTDEEDRAAWPSEAVSKVGVWLIGAGQRLMPESLVARLDGDLEAVEARVRPGFADGRGRAKGLQVPKVG